MAQARVDVLREVQMYDPGDWRLCFQWCRYRSDEVPVQYGYRFIWRRPENGSLQAARGQARIPSLKAAHGLMTEAGNEGWGNRDGDWLETAAKRLREAGCVVDLATGYVGWPDKNMALKGNLSEQDLEDAKRIQAWTR